MIAFYGSSPNQRQGSRQSWRECSGRQSELRRGLKEHDLFGDIDDDWHEAAVRKDFSKLNRVRDLDGRLTIENFTRSLRTLLNIERAHDAISLRVFDMFEQNLTIQYHLDKDGKPTAALNYFGITVEGLSNGQPSLVPNDIVIMRSRAKFYRVAKIERIINDLVVLPKEKFYDNQTYLSGQLDIFFVSSDLLHKYYLRALERFDNDASVRHRIFQYAEELAESKSKSESEPESGLESEPELESRRGYEHNPEPVEVSPNQPEDEERMKQLNEPQRRAIANILKNTSWPKPYILFGPPGTGKTHTLAEAIAQIYVRQPRRKILYCANSNTCADQMIGKLNKIPFISSEDIMRLSAGERVDGIDMSRIIVTTNMKSASLMDEYKFDYVIMDEAGHAHEAESLLPICCLKGRGCLVLAGDPKQLGPVVKCEQADKHGLGKSLFERVFNFDRYKRDSTTGQYNSKYITKLLISYRCDPRVLAIPNKLFYDNELECANETPKSILKMMNISNPLQLLHVGGQEKQLKNSTSRCNFDEVDKCVDLIVRLYKMGLTPDQIGVSSPYKQQAKMIRKKLDEKLRDNRYFLEERFRETEMVRRKKDKKKSTQNKPDTENKSSEPERLAFDLDKLKLGEVEEFDLEQQDKADADEEEYEWVEVIKERTDNWMCKIDSVDAYQGNEREIMIISTVRTPRTGRTDFINDHRRFNVAISRTKWLVFVIGHRSVLEDQSNWCEFVRRAGDEVTRWPQQYFFDSKHPFEQLIPLFRRA